MIISHSPRRRNPCVGWFENAIVHHGVRSNLFDLHILVPGIQAAAAITLRAGEVSRASLRRLKNDGVKQEMSCVVAW